jgi:hypothetical protein
VQFSERFYILSSSHLKIIIEDILRVESLNKILAINLISNYLLLIDYDINGFRISIQGFVDRCFSYKGDWNKLVQSSNTSELRQRNISGIIITDYPLNFTDILHSNIVGLRVNLC